MTGLTFGGAGSLVTDAYLFTGTYTAPGKAPVTKTYQHALHSTIGNKKGPESLEPKSVNDAFAEVLEQLIQPPGGRLKARIAGNPGQNYLIQATTNLVDWVTLGGTTALGNGTCEFEDAESDKLRARFYRVISRQPTVRYDTGTGTN